MHSRSWRVCVRFVVCISTCKPGIHFESYIMSSTESMSQMYHEKRNSVTAWQYFNGLCPIVVDSHIGSEQHTTHSISIERIRNPLL